MIIAVIFLILGAICNACMDTLAHHYYNSIFNRKGYNAKFWNPVLSSTEAYIIPYTKYKLDAWHLFKSLMICFLIGAIIMSWQSGEAILNVWWFYLTVYIFLGIGWNLVFNLFYNIILVRHEATNKKTS